MTVRLRTAAALLTFALVAACTAVPGQVPARTTSATPSLTCTGTGPTPAPSPCDEKTRDSEQRALEDQARATLDRFWREYNRLSKAGGADGATPELKATVAEPMLGNIVAVLKYQREQTWKPDPFIVNHKLQIQPIQIRPDAEVSILTCEDLTGSILYDAAGKRAGQGGMAVQAYALKRMGGAMTIYDGDGKFDATECPI